MLTEILHRGNHTSFKVRRAFETSPSSSWSGSAGAVYPAIARLEKAGFIEAEVGISKRGTRLLSLTATGKDALKAWLFDAETACSIGADPFRLRAGLWETFDQKERGVVVAVMKAAVRAQMEKLEIRTSLDPVEQTGNQLAIRLQSLRLEWLEAFSSQKR